MIAAAPKTAALTPKELSAVLERAGAPLSARTIRDRMHLWAKSPAHPLGIPYLVNLGRPYRIPGYVVDRLLTAPGAAV